MTRPYLRKLLVCLNISVAIPQVSLAEAITKSDIIVLEPTQLSDWDEKSFKGNTRYTQTKMNDTLCIQAQSKASASGLFRNMRIDLMKTPYLHWNWYIHETLGEINEEEKPFDDYAARIYVVISGGLFFWKTRALNYVWANKHDKGQNWPNAYSANAIMIAVESGAELTKTWQHERRNVRNDIKNYLGLDADQIDAIAFMTDTDDTGKSASACYANIYFSQQ